jgi:3'(2'), 5'-bisphosphate nucleotidase
MCTDRVDLTNGRALANALLPSVLAAAKIQLSYFRASTAVTTKADRTPVTLADQESEAVLLQALKIVAPDITVVAEEDMAAGAKPVIGNTFFLVDPLDGTREFIANRPEFTINIALIRFGHPVFGLIYAPALGRFYVTLTPNHAISATLPINGAMPTNLGNLTTSRLTARHPSKDGLVVATSHSHMNAKTEAYLSPFNVALRQLMGSSLKFCRIAEGEADVYPRVGPTCEWDTAAGQAILEAAGGAVLDLGGHPLVYGNSAISYKNPAFVAWGIGGSKTAQNIAPALKNVRKP